LLEDGPFVGYLMIGIMGFVLGGGWTSNAVASVRPGRQEGSQLEVAPTGRIGKTVTRSPCSIGGNTVASVQNGCSFSYEEWRDPHRIIEEVIELLNYKSTSPKISA